MLVTKNPDIGYGLTFLQFIVVSLASLPQVFSFRHFRWRPRRLSPSLLALMCLVFFVVSALNNAVFAFNISMPLHTTFRSSSLVVNMLLGVCVFRKRYSYQQIICGCVITVGIIVLTLETSKRAGEDLEVPVEAPLLKHGEISAVSDVAATPPTRDDGGGDSAVSSQLTGISILVFTVALSTLLGLIQDKMMSMARTKQQPLGKNAGQANDIAPAPVWAEAMFYAHAATIPLYFLQRDRLITEVEMLFSTSESLWLVGLNCFTQFVCVCGVYQLADRTSSFTVTLTLTLRKFMSVVFSVIYFGHHEKLGIAEWASIAAVAAGGLLYPFVPKPSDTANNKVEDEKKRQ